MTVPGVNVICAADVPGRGRRHPPLPRRSRKLVGYLGLDPRVYQSGSDAGQGRADLQAGLAAGALGAGRGRLVAWSSSPARCTRSTSASAPAAATQIAVVAVARKLAVPVLVPAHPRRGLRPPAALADRQEAAPARDPRRRADAQGHQHRHLGDPAEDAPSRARARPTGRGLLQADGLRLASSSAEEGGRERDTGARIDQGPRRAKSRGRSTSPRRLLFDTSSTRAHDAA